MAKWINWAAIVLSVIVMHPLHAGDQSEGPFGRVEYFNWEEYDESGARLLRERGPRIGIGVEGNNFKRDLPGFVYRFSGMGYVGSVAYEGQVIETKAPVNTSTDYLGLSLDAMGGQRYGYIIEPHRLDVMFGGGVDLWLRNLRNSHDSNGNAAQGYRETYLAWTLKTAVGVSHKVGDGYGYILGGVKLPIYVTEWPTLYNVALNPQGRPSLFFKWTIANALSYQKTGLAVSFFYDSWRFAQSPRVSSGKVYVWQPKSKMDVVGVEIELQ